MRCAAVQEILQDEDTDMMGANVDVRDVAAAHVRAAEVGAVAPGLLQLRSLL